MDILLTPTMLAAIPVLVGVVQVIKTAGLPDRWAPAISLVLGLGVGLLAGGTPLVVVLGGLVIGLSASGMYSGAKATFSKTPVQPVG